MSTQTRSANRINLDVISVKDPCHVDWDHMQGDERVRFCGQCNHNVYNISEMSRKEAQDLIASREGRLCVRYYMRQDGTVISKDCSLIRKAIRKSKAMLTATYSTIAAMLVAAVGLGSSQSKASSPTTDNTNIVVKGEMAAPTMGKVAIQGDIAPIIQPQATMGIIALPQHIPSTQPTTRPATQPTTRPVKAEDNK